MNSNYSNQELISATLAIYHNNQKSSVLELKKEIVIDNKISKTDPFSSTLNLTKEII